MTSSQPNPLLKAPHPALFTSGVRVSTCDLAGGTGHQSLTRAVSVLLPSDPTSASRAAPPPTPTGNWNSFVLTPATFICYICTPPFLSVGTQAVEGGVVKLHVSLLGF